MNPSADPAGPDPHRSAHTPDMPLRRVPGEAGHTGLNSPASSPQTPPIPPSRTRDGSRFWHHPLLWLTLAVSVAHVWLLSDASSSLMSAPEGSTVVRMDTRTLALPAAPSVAAPPRAPKRPAPAAEAATPAPAPEPPTAPQTTEPTPSQAPAPTPTLAAPAPAPVPSASSPSVATVTTAVTPTTSVTAQVPMPTKLRYEVKGQRQGLDYFANAELGLQHNGQEYEAKLAVSAFLVGSRVDSSQGRIGPGGLEPLRYSQKYRGEQAAHFQREAGKITFSNNRPETPLLPGAQDRVSVLLQLAAQLQALSGPSAWPSQLQWQVASSSGAEVWQFRLEGQDTLQLDMGEHPAYKWHRAPKGEYGQRVEVWISARTQWLPVRLRITNANADFVDLFLKEWPQ